MKDDTFITKRITNADVYKELQQQHATLKDVLEQTKRTNGRVTELEKRAEINEGKILLNIISKYPFRFTIFILAFISFVVSDIRHPLFDLLIKLLF